jgi:hypothetical protein
MPDDFMRSYRAHLYDPENLRKRHAKIEWQIQEHRRIEAGRSDRKARASVTRDSPRTPRR